MLDKELRRRLYEHQDWDRAARYKEILTDGVKMEKLYSNPSLRWRRTLEAATTAISDLILLANTLPEEKQKELFTLEKISELLGAILGKNIQARYYKLANDQFNKVVELESSEAIKKINAKIAANVKDQYEQMKKIGHEPSEKEMQRIRENARDSLSIEEKELLIKVARENEIREETIKEDVKMQRIVDSRRTQIAEIVAEKGIEYCSRQVMILGSNFAKEVISSLSDASDLIKRIANEVELNEKKQTVKSTATLKHRKQENTVK